MNFPIDGLDLEERIGERKVARSLNLNDEDAAKYGIEKGDEPMMYDLCESSSLNDYCVDLDDRCGRQSLRWDGRWALHSFLPEQGGWRVVQL